MRKSIFLLSFLASFLSEATIWKVNNQTSVSFASIQSAINSASVVDGDTLYIEGSSALYDGFTLDKRLVIIGPGYFLTENPETGVNATPVLIDNDALFQSGSEGSQLMGVRFSFNTFNDPAPELYTNNITIRKCYLPFGIKVATSIQGLNVLQNYFDNNQDYDAFTLNTFNDPLVYGTVFMNNIVNADFENDNTSSTLSFAAVENNLFLEDVNVSTSTYRNNIWLPQVSSNISVSAGVREFNLTLTVDLGTENNNQIITGSSDLYSTDGSTDGKWQIKSDSEFLTAGKEGTEPGPFGGNNPYELSGVPNIPIIYELTTTGIATDSEGLPVTIKVKAN